VEAWSNHDFEEARRSLAPDVRVTATTTDPGMKDTNLIGVEEYMRGLIEFAQGVIPGSAQVLASAGDDRNALLMVSVKAVFGPEIPEVTLPAARLYLLDADNKIRDEQVVFFAMPD
jgi:hypothetical protein